MADGQVTVNLRADPRAYEQGIKKAEQATDDFQRSAEQGLDDVDAKFAEAIVSVVELGRSVGKTADQIESDLEGMGLSAEQAGRSIELAGKAGGDGLGKGIKSGSVDAASAMQELGGIAQDVLKGDFASGAQGAVDAVAGITSAIPGIGTAVGIAAGAVGLITAEFQRQQEEAEKLRERIGSMYQSAAEDGRAYLDTAQLIAEANDVMFNPDRAGEWKQLQADANMLGLERADIIAANGGDLEAQELVQGRINALLKEAAEERRGYGNGSDISTFGQELVHVRDRWKGIGDATKEAADKAEVAKQVTSDFLQQMIADAGSAEVEVDALGNKLITLETGTKVLVEADTGLATRDVAKFQGDIDGIKDKVVGFKTQVERGSLDALLRENFNKTFNINVKTNYQTPAAGSLAWQ